MGSDLDKAFEKVAARREQSALERKQELRQRARVQSEAKTHLDSKKPFQEQLAAAIRMDAAEAASLFVSHEIPADLNLQRTVKRSVFGFRRVIRTPAWKLATSKITTSHMNSSFDNWAGERYTMEHDRYTVLSGSGELLYVTYGVEEREITADELVPPNFAPENFDRLAESTLKRWQTLYISRLERGPV